MARLWKEVQRDKHIFPFVQFDVVMDDHTSDICSPLNKVIMSVDDMLLIIGRQTISTAVQQLEGLEMENLQKM